MDASAPEFVPAARKTVPREDSGGTNGEVHGDRLIRQLAAALAAAPPTETKARPYAIPADGLFCPDCIAGRTCTFHRPGSAALGWGAPAAPPAAPAASPAQTRPAMSASASSPPGTLGQSCLGRKAQPDSRWPLATAPPPPSAPPAGPPPALPAANLGEGMQLPRGLVLTPGWPWPADDRREAVGKGAAELDDTSTDVGGSEPHHAESDTSDPSPDSASTASLRWRGQRALEASASHKTVAGAALSRGPAKQRAAGAGRSTGARWSSRHSSQCSAGKGTR